MEAYQAVYAPQEITEEQVWEEVENWVNSLVEEGYDLSDYTWEEMYESYLEEAGMDVFKAIRDANSKPSSVFTQPIKKAPPLGQPGSGFQDRRPVLGMPSNNSLTLPPNRVGPGLVGGKVGPKIVGPKIVGPGKVGPDAAPAPRSITPPARPSTAPAGGTGRPTPTATTTPTPAPSAPRQKDTSITDMIGRSQVRQGAAVNTGSSTSDARAIAARSSVGATPKPAPSTATAKPTPRQARLNMEMEYDTFDTVLEHLVSEGYADTEESALVIMANMSEEWREEILDEANRPEREMIKKGLLKSSQVGRVRNLERDSAGSGGSAGAWYGQDPRDQPSIQRPGRSFGRTGPNKIKQRRQKDAQQFDAFYTSQRRDEHDKSRGKKTKG
jgi:hypothetical protein